MSTKFKGNAITIKGEHVNGDVAMGWYLGMDGLPAQEIAAKFMSGYNPEIAKIAKKDDILVCGRNFGFGKIHTSLWIAMKTIGIKCAIAESFSTQMFQNALLNGIYLLECPGILSAVEMGDEIEVDIENAVVTNITQNKVTLGKKTSEFVLNVMNSGGYVGYLAKKISAKAQQQK